MTVIYLVMIYEFIWININSIMNGHVSSSPLFKICTVKLIRICWNTANAHLFFLFDFNCQSYPYYDSMLLHMLRNFVYNPYIFLFLLLLQEIQTSDYDNWNRRVSYNKNIGITVDVVMILVMHCAVLLVRLCTQFFLVMHCAVLLDLCGRASDLPCLFLGKVTFSDDSSSACLWLFRPKQWRRDKRDWVEAYHHLVPVSSVQLHWYDGTA